STQPSAETAAPLQQILLPASFAIASYRASLLPLLGDSNESALQGATAAMARLPLQFTSKDKMQRINDSQVAAMSIANLEKLNPHSNRASPSKEQKND
ncbi:MAG: hypothetical protein K2X63_06820, partial [Burkholderiaceae bacterium]|nr:hypothetical protein [Burkholderiaceae bacterium]